MPGARLPMRKIRDMLRLTAAGMSSRKIAASLSIGGTTVVDCLQRARAVGVGWPLPEELSDVALEARLFPASTALAAIKSRRTQADWPAIHRELKRPGVTLRLLWHGGQLWASANVARGATFQFTVPAHPDTAL